ncbi:hypothetical protein NIES2119_07440 [[Phormidium ambiguum] IAM M-71]|uniref:DUF4079 domain-containing protein n=1 Tax=[Phormidium ambiguum] IAM M-71 TaxID=454136 RepID=A0A1U7INQ0_9CYAN|nr:DUF4079 domain-containing protein [Phormidium ambiguum]OKH38967.1 hypothetical protein NIES2119_07440 [Phormidium ambiguum IAM M-71]
MNLPDFIWLWKIAAWSMGLAIAAYWLLGMTGFWMFYTRLFRQQRPDWLRPFHYLIGGLMVALVLLLLAIGIIGTLGHYGSLGHSSHLPVGITVVALVLVSAISATQISPRRPWVRYLHIGSNIVLLIGFLLVTLTGWSVVQKYLP